MGPDGARTGTTWRRTTAAYALVVLAPAVAWLAFASWADDKSSDQANVAWFVAVAVASMVAGAVARPRGWRLAGLWVVAAVVTTWTLYAWWSSEADDGLFLIGIALAVPYVALVAPLLLLAGRRVTTGRRADN